MKSILIFIAGALVGVACVMLFVTDNGRNPPEIAVLKRTQPTAPAAAAPPQNSVPPPKSPTPAEVAPPYATPESLADAAPAPLFQTQPGSLKIPVAGISPSKLSDSFNELRGNNLHGAIDIAAPRGTPVVAVDDGKVVKLFNSKPGGLTVYQFDPSAEFAYYYAHLDRYAPGLAEGQQLKRGELIGYVGSTGNANPAAPHLHFAVFKLGPEKRWWKGTAINPYPLFGGR